MATSQTQKIELGIVRYEYGDVNRPQRGVLELETGKGFRGGLRSSATVFWYGHHSKCNLISFRGGGDFSNSRVFQNPTARATQKAIDTQHAAVFTAEVVAQLTADAKAHYAKFIADGKDGMGNTGYLVQEVAAHA